MFKDLGNVRIAYDVFGSGTPIILVGGFGANRRFWKNAIPLLDGFTIVTMDARGVGETEYEGEFTLDDIADDAVALMHSFGFDRFYAIGWSMGTGILQSLSARYPEKVIAQALVSTFSHCPARSAYILGEFTRMINEGSATMESLCVAVNAFCFPESVFEKYQSEGKVMPVPHHMGKPKGLSDQLKATFSFDPESYLPRITSPTIVVQGTEDIMTPFYKGEAVHSKVIGSEIFAVEGAGHTIPPESYMSQVLDFFRRRTGL